MHFINLSLNLQLIIMSLFKLWFYSLMTFVPLLTLFQLLTIFVSAKLAAYVKFYQNNKDFIDSLGKYPQL